MTVSTISLPLGISNTLAQPWSKAESMPTARSEIAATSIGDDIYVIGGLDELLRYRNHCIILQPQVSPEKYTW